MTAERNDLTMRPLGGREELDLFSRLPYVVSNELAGDLDSGRRRPEWMWVALRGDRLLARVAWWCRPGDDAPFLLDILDIDDGPERIDIGVRLLKTAMAGAPLPTYTCFVPPGWRDDPVARQVVEDRMTALERTGARLFVERLRLEWWPETPVPEPSGRLTFRPVGAAGELLALMTAVLDGTLDAHSRDDLTRMSAREAAAAHYEGEPGPLLDAPGMVADRDASGRRAGGVRPSGPQRLQPDHRLPRRPARPPRQRIYRRHPRRGHTRPGGRARAADPGGHGPRQRSDGAGVPARRIRRFRAPDRHDLELMP